MPGPLKTVTAVIPTHNRKASLLRVLEQLEQAGTGGIALSVTVVADGCTDGTMEAVNENFPGVKVIRGTGDWWWTRSVNEGLKQALHNKAGAVLLLNDDTHFGPDYLEKLFSAAQAHPGAIVGTLNITTETSPRIFFSGAHRLRWWDGKLLRYHSFLAPYDGALSGVHKSVVLPGRGVLIPAEVFYSIGTFDEKRLPHYKADYDFVLRAFRRGIETLVTWDAVILTPVDSTGAGSTFKAQKIRTFVSSLFYRYSRSNLLQNFIYYKRHLPTPAFFLLPFTGLLVLGRQVLQFVKFGREKD